MLHVLKKKVITKAVVFFWSCERKFRLVLETERKDLRKSKSAIDQLTKPVNGVSSQKNGAQFLSRPLAYNSLSGATKIQFKKIFNIDFINEIL